MKTLTLSTLLLVILSFGSAFGQTLKKGSLVGLHTTTVQLDPDVTMNQFKEFVLSKYIPASNKNIPGMTTFLLEGKRGENANSLGWMFLFDSEEDRNKYFNEDGTPSELWEAANQKMEAINDELNKLGTWTSVYTDWIVQ